jgi:hypothetical protein
MAAAVDGGGAAVAIQMGLLVVGGGTPILC